MIVQTFSLDNLLNKKHKVEADPYREFRNLTYQKQLDEILSVHHEKEKALMEGIVELLECAVQDDCDMEVKKYLEDFRHIVRQ